MWTEVLDQVHQDILKLMQNGGTYTLVDVEADVTREDRIEKTVELLCAKVTDAIFAGNTIAVIEYPLNAFLSLEDVGYLLNKVMEITGTENLVWYWKDSGTINTLHLYLIAEVIQ
jgi:hypothetical protein